MATKPGRNRLSGKHSLDQMIILKWIENKWVGRVKWINLKDETYVWGLLGTF
jgi:hypothetical protein